MHYLSERALGSDRASLQLIDSSTPRFVACRATQRAVRRPLWTSQLFIRTAECLKSVVSDGQCALVERQGSESWKRSVAGRLTTGSLVSVDLSDQIVAAAVRLTTSNRDRLEIFELSRFTSGSRMPIRHRPEVASIDHHRRGAQCG